MTVYIENLVVAGLANGLAPDGTRSSAGTVLTTKHDMIFSLAMKYFESIFVY